MPVVWAPYTLGEIKRIESVQKQFLLFALKPLGFTGFHLPSYENRLLLLNMTTLENRREIAFAMLAFDLYKGRIKVPNLVNRVEVRNTNYNLRNQRILSETSHNNNFLWNDSIDRSIRIFNKFREFFSNDVSRETFKKKLNDNFK